MVILDSILCSHYQATPEERDKLYDELMCNESDFDSDDDEEDETLKRRRRKGRKEPIRDIFNNLLPIHVALEPELYKVFIA